MDEPPLEGRLAGQDGEDALAGRGGAVEHGLGAERLDQPHLGGDRARLAGTGEAQVLGADADGQLARVRRLVRGVDAAGRQEVHAAARR